MRLRTLLIICCSMLPSGVFASKINLGECQVAHGNVLANEDVQAILQRSLGDSPSVSECIAASLNIESDFRQAGAFTARVYVEPSESADIVLLRVIEGRLARDGIELFNSGERVEDGVLLGLLNDTLIPGSPLTADKYERAILLANDTPGILTSSNVLKPGYEVGEAIFSMATTDAPETEGFVYADNFGSTSTGEYRLGGLLHINSPLRQGDRLTVGLNASDKDTYFGFADASIPIWLPGMRAGLTVDALDYNTDESSGLKGDSLLLEAYLHYALLRARQSNVFLEFRVGRESMQDQSDFGTVTDRVVDAAKFKLQGDHIDGLGGGGTNSLELEFVVGYLDLDGFEPYKQQDAITAKTAGNFEKLSWKASRLQHISGPWQSMLELAGQFASKRLDGSQSIAFGGAYDFPGYKSGEILGDEGFRAHWDVRYNTVLPALGGNTQVSLFYDVGTIKTHAIDIIGGLIVPGTDEQHFTMQSTGMGFNQQWQRTQLQGALAWRIDNEIPDNLLDDDSNSMLAWLQLGYKF